MTTTNQEEYDFIIGKNISNISITVMSVQTRTVTTAPSTIHGSAYLMLPQKERISQFNTRRCYGRIRKSTKTGYALMNKIWFRH